MTFCTLVPPLYEAPVTDWIRHHMYRQLGAMPDGTPYHVTLERIQEAVQAKRDPHFDEVRNARLTMGHLRYETTGRDFLDKVGSAIKRLQEYVKTGNREHLADAANLIEIEWCRPSFEGAYWESQDCGGHWSLRNN
jgi:hypothetical protein